MTDPERLKLAKNVLDKMMTIEKFKVSTKLIKIRELIIEELSKADPKISGSLAKTSDIWEFEQ